MFQPKRVAETTSVVRGTPPYLCRAIQRSSPWANTAAGVHEHQLSRPPRSGGGGGGGGYGGGGGGGGFGGWADPWTPVWPRRRAPPSEVTEFSSEPFLLKPVLSRAAPMRQRDRPNRWRRGVRRWRWGRRVHNKEKARFCVVVVAPAKTCYNVRHRCTPEMPAPGKRDPQYGDKEIRGDQSIWVVRSLDEGGK
eukprot:gene17944-biopygen61697